MFRDARTDGRTDRQTHEQPEYIMLPGHYVGGGITTPERCQSLRLSEKMYLTVLLERVHSDRLLSRRATDKLLHTVGHKK